MTVPEKIEKIEYGFFGAIRIMITALTMLMVEVSKMMIGVTKSGGKASISAMDTTYYLVGSGESLAELNFLETKAESIGKRQELQKKFPDVDFDNL